jgi:hypothetical protein
MDLSDVFLKDGEIRDLYCDSCGNSMDLVFQDFSEIVSGIKINIHGLPYLRCHECNRVYLTDESRLAIIETHRQATEKNSPTVNVTKKKRPVDYKFTDVPFLVDADDYAYIPGLKRPFDKGFLTPLYFNKAVLLKFDNSPNYSVQFASQSYGTVDTHDSYISFGINRHGKVIMWLGDVASLPESEQFYLRSENVPSDHSVGSEFYDGQIECKFTDPPIEKIIITGRSELDKMFATKFGAKLFHLDAEVIDTIAGLSPPLVDTEKERKHVFDSLNRIFVESIDNQGLEKLLATLSVTSTGSGALKRLQATLGTIQPVTTVATLMMPFYVTYDLRVAYSHLTSATKRASLLASAESRLGLTAGASLTELYDALVQAIGTSVKRINSALK